MQNTPLCACHLLPQCILLYCVPCQPINYSSPIDFDAYVFSHAAYVKCLLVVQQRATHVEQLKCNAMIHSLRQLSTSWLIMISLSGKIAAVLG